MKDGSIGWPDGKRFAFTIFDDPDSQTTEDGREVYAFLRDLGFRTTKGVWPTRGPREPSDHGETCDEPDHRKWLLELQAEGFEIGFHNVTLHTSTRDEIERGLDRFRAIFGSSPRTFAQHYFCDENLYWGDQRLSGAYRAMYNVLTRFKNHARFHGHVEGHPYFWGDLCRAQVTYVRNFVFANVDTLESCPFMPYFDPARPYVHAWYSGTEGSNLTNFVRSIDEAAQDRLIERGSLCIMYTHFGHGFVDGGRLNRRFMDLMTRLAASGGWFVPVGRVLDLLRERNGGVHTLTSKERNTLERRWLAHKVRYGTA